MNDVQVRYCSATSEWSKDDTCENVCGKNEFIKKLKKILKFYFLVGACCGASETDGCVDNLLFKDCDSSSEWTHDQTCANVCGNCLFQKKNEKNKLFFSWFLLWIKRNKWLC